ncbi:hypothetical protein [Geodermatophilus chilensis]|uniref:hypothetical protein n=1 Tax=Geodermatophilus chilensis TaxID=2035835 RepID=UPI000C25FE4C|nr:hypothetical protein [Geodermatophilus chilensis]
MRTATRRTVVPAAAGLTGLCAAVLLSPAGTGAARAEACDEERDTVVVTDEDEVAEVLATAAPGTVVVVDTGGLTGEVRVEGDCAPGAATGEAPAGSIETAFLTGYSLEDNSPPGTRSTSSGRSAGGTGTYADPITLAVGYAGGDEFPRGTVFYVPLVRAYFVVEDRCGACSDPTSAADYTVDLWVGSDPDDSCMYAITGPHTVVRDAGPGWVVESRPDELGADCRLFGETPTPA